MKNLIQSMLEKAAPHFHKGGKFEAFYPLYELPESVLLTPSTPTTSGAHVRDFADLKRLMITVMVALLPVTVFAMWNVGYQGYIAQGVVAPDFWSCLAIGAWYMIPIFAVTYAVGGFWEMIFSVVRKHEINEGFMVTGMLFPLILPATTPLWMVAMGISFGVVIGKEVFGGTGMNILNPALTARAFVFFAYPSAVSGAKVWDIAGKETAPFGIFGGPSPFMQGTLVDGYTGATPLLQVASGAKGDSAVQLLTQAGWSFSDLAFGFIPGSAGEVSAIAIAFGAVVLIGTGIASWRVMAGSVLGLFLVTSGFNAMAGPEVNAMMSLPFHYHLVMGGFAFGTVFMATDPVTAAITPTGRWLYGVGIGLLCGLVRVINPAYPEGMMLSILFMNVFAPLIDYYVVKGMTAARRKRMASN